MAREKTVVKAAHINYASSRWQLTRPAKVGQISDLLHESKATTLDEWLTYYDKHGTDPQERKAIALELFGHIRERALRPASL